ncbi:MAG: RDD family protein [Alphaproteobacteria bacterium]|nr:RDD family protein [Alphaproteobacteria bacterium]
MTNVPPPAPVWDAQPPGPAATGYGGFWIRVVAYIIDIILLDIGLYIVAAIVGMPVVPTHYSAGDSLTDALGQFQLLSLVVTWLYFSLMESSARGATVGKMAVGLRVVTDQGNRLSFLRATGRFFAKFVSALLLGIGFLMVAFTDTKRGLHDMMAGTLVVKSR